MIGTMLRFLLDKNHRLLVAATAGLIVVGTTTFHFLEGWSWLDSLYFCVITMATVGYGDFSPQTDFGKIFVMMYIFWGMGVFVAFAQSYFNFIKDSRRLKYKE